MQQSQELKDYLSEERLQQFINCCLHYLADLQIPQKRGTFIEYRTGMLNISPIGRNCSQAERDAFELYDQQHHIRTDFITFLRNKFPDFGLQYSIGGQISFDVFPIGWDKRYCLSFVEQHFDTIHFFGDKCDKGGNDHEIYEHFKQKGTAHFIKDGPAETIRILEELLPIK